MNAAWWFVLALVVAIGVFEGWAVVTHHLTISQVTRRWFRQHPYWGSVAIGLLGLLIVHLFFGGPF